MPFRQGRTLQTCPVVTYVPQDTRTPYSQRPLVFWKILSSKWYSSPQMEERSRKPSLSAGGHMHHPRVELIVPTGWRLPISDEEERADKVEGQRRILEERWSFLWERIQMVNLRDDVKESTNAGACIDRREGNKRAELE